MIDLLIHNAKLIHPGENIEPGWLGISADKITAVGTATTSPPEATIHLNANGKRLSPGLIDVHTHGIGPYLYERDPEEILASAPMLAQFGTTCVLPTLYRVMQRPSLKHLERLAAVLSRVTGICMPGFHLEGPFLALAGAGAATLPGDVGLLDELLAACGGKVRAMSVSPETPNILPVIEQLIRHGVTPFVTHTRATAEQTQAAIDAGARHATHFYDVFPMPPETEPGVRPTGAVEAFLADPRASVDFIADGIHVHPTAIRAAVAAKGFAGIVLITDSNIGAGMPAGEFETPWGFRVRVSPTNAARIAEATHPDFNGLAGSSLTMNAGLRNLLAWIKLPPGQVWAMATGNPARLVGLARKGTLQPGADADLVLWNDDLTPARTLVAGKTVYESSGSLP